MASGGSAEEPHLLSFPPVFKTHLSYMVENTVGYHLKSKTPALELLCFHCCLFHCAGKMCSRPPETPTYVHEWQRGVNEQQNATDDCMVPRNRLLVFVISIAMATRRQFAAVIDRRLTALTKRPQRLEPPHPPLHPPHPHPKATMTLALQWETKDLQRNGSKTWAKMLLLRHLSECFWS